MSGKAVADDLLRAGYERWSRIEDAKTAVADDSKELFAELKAQGFDTKALRVSFRRVRDAASAEVAEQEALVDLYVAGIMRDPQMRARENIEEFGADVGREVVEYDAETGEILENEIPPSQPATPLPASNASDRHAGDTAGQPIQESELVTGESFNEAVAPSSDESVIGREAVPHALPATIQPETAAESTAARKDVPNVEADTFPDAMRILGCEAEAGGRDAAIAGTQALPVDTNPRCLKHQRGETCWMSHQVFSCSSCNHVAELAKARKWVSA